MNEFLRGLAIALAGFGSFMAVPGVIALTGLTSLELEFFGIEVDTQAEQLVWTMGSIVAAVVGYSLLRWLPSKPE